MNRNVHKTWIEISKNNLLHNVDIFRHITGGEVMLGGVVKSNAYGHGLAEVSRIIGRRVDYLAVDSIDEALQIKKYSKRILILGYTMKSRLPDVVANGFELIVSNIETLDELGKVCAKFKKKAFVHIKIETGTARQGVYIKDLGKYLASIEAHKYLVLAGMSTHYANIEDTTDHSFADCQLALFKKAVAMLEKAGINNVVKHTACTAATILFPETYFDLVRVGIGFYGMWPSRETYVSSLQLKKKITLKPVLTWKTIIAQIKDVPVGTAIGYGCTEKVKTRSKIAIIPVGYYDGLRRSLSSVGEVLIRGKRCRIIGRICMNMTIVDVTHVRGIALEDEVVLIGSQGKEIITAEELAQKAQTINYEITTCIGSHIPRIII